MRLENRRIPGWADVANLPSLGTFTDNLSAPVHRWFRYPAGFSHRAVEEAIRIESIQPGMCIYDPFVGTGTTCIVAKLHGIDSIGVEAHPFIYSVAKAKLDWELPAHDLAGAVRCFAEWVQSDLRNASRKANLDGLPKLVRTCFDESNLRELVAIRDRIQSSDLAQQHRALLTLCLAATLRPAACVETGWSYVLPRRSRKLPAPAASRLFMERLRLMLEDLTWIHSQDGTRGQVNLIQGDARLARPPGESSAGTSLDEASVDMVFTSPPYLNNYDYADRTRLEMYFLGLAGSWNEITLKVRDRLLVSATTQVRRDGEAIDDTLAGVRQVSAAVYRSVKRKCGALDSERRKRRSGKNYDVMVAMYFRDITKVLRQLLPVVKPGRKCLLILGDSAPYGIHIPTHEYLAQIGIDLGFSEVSLHRLRTRGTKWRTNSRRHKVSLSETLVILTR